MVLLRAGLWTVAAAAAAAAAAYDEDAAGLAISAPGAEFRGGPALGASGATGATRLLWEHDSAMLSLPRDAICIRVLQRKRCG